MMENINNNGLLFSKGSLPPLEDAKQAPSAHGAIYPQSEKVKALANQLNTIEGLKIEGFGSQAQKESAQFSTVLLDAMQENQITHINQSIKDTAAKINTLSPDRRGGFFKRLFAKKAYSKQLREQFIGLEGEIDQIARLMNQYKVVLLKDIALMDELHKRNLKSLQELTNYVEAGEEVLHRLKEAVPPIKEEGEEVELMNTQEQENIKKLSRRVQDLKTSKVLAMQMAPQIRLMQNNDQILLGKIQEIVSTTLPLWKNQLSLSLGLANTRQALETQKNVTSQAKTALNNNKKQMKKQKKALEKSFKENKKGGNVLEKEKQELVKLFQGVIDEQNDFQKSRDQIQRELKHAIDLETVMVPVTEEKQAVKSRRDEVIK